jgi:hypothetical protein
VVACAVETRLGGQDAELLVLHYEMAAPGTVPTAPEPMPSRLPAAAQPVAVQAIPDPPLIDARLVGWHGNADPHLGWYIAPREVAMTSRKDFTDEEWIRIRRAPFVAGFAISIADPGGPIELTKETMASLRSATLPPSQEELLTSVALDVQAITQQRQNPLGDYKPTSGQQVLDELRGVNQIVTAKATPQEVEAFHGWLVATAQAAADAAKEGGFMGFGAEQVSAGEKVMLNQLRAALGAT